MARIKSEAPARSLSESGREAAPHSQVVYDIHHDVKVYSEDTGNVIATAGRYYVQVVRDRATAVAVSLMRRSLTDLAAAFPTFGYLLVLEPESKLLMPPDVRAGIDACVKRFTNQITGAAIVFEKTGFHATAVRSVVTAINLASRATHPNQVFAELPLAVSWLASLTPGEPTAARLLQIVKQLRSTPDTIPDSTALL